MKHVADQPVIQPEQVSEELARAGAVVSPEQALLIARHANAVLTANQTMNLTRVMDADGVLRLHIVDSATALAALAACPAGPLVDIGSGAGYPGFVLEILSGRPTTLVESVKKKAVFLAETATILDLPTTVLGERAEDVARQTPAAYACVVARAVSSLPSLVELAAPLLFKKGQLIAMKGPLGSDELLRGDAAAALCGMSRSSLSTFELTQGEKRTIVCYSKTGHPTQALPRRTGLAQRHPLT